MSNDFSVEDEELKTEILYVAKDESSSSLEPPMEEWSSLYMVFPELNKKKILYNKGLYDPGSGEICMKYLPQSDSEILRHPYYWYRSVKDPGILEALLEPEPHVPFGLDGQDLYMHLCEEMEQCPVRKFHENLLNSTINLSYYCVDPKGVRAMGMALRYNRYVTHMNLTDNHLSTDACFHLGDMLTENCTITDLILPGCRIGEQGVQRLVLGLKVNRTLKKLDLSRNKLGEQGGVYFAEAIESGLELVELNLSCNELAKQATIALTAALETNNSIQVLDLSQNLLFEAIPTSALLVKLRQNKKLRELKLKWNSLTGERIGAGLKNTLFAPKLQHLDLSYNKLDEAAMKFIIQGMIRGKKMTTLDLSFNPITPNDALKALERLKLKKCKIKRLLLDNVAVTPEFLETHGELLADPLKEDRRVTWGVVLHDWIVTGPDPRELVLNRLDRLGQKPKKIKQRIDVALLFKAMLRDGIESLDVKEFMQKMAAFKKVKYDEDLVTELADLFPFGRSEKFKKIDVKALNDYITRKWPERVLPPPPPPKIEKVETVTKGKGKGKKGKKK